MLINGIFWHDFPLLPHWAAILRAHLRAHPPGLAFNQFQPLTVTSICLRAFVNKQLVGGWCAELLCGENINIIVTTCPHLTGTFSLDCSLQFGKTSIYEGGSIALIEEEWRLTSLPLFTYSLWLTQQTLMCLRGKIFYPCSCWNAFMCASECAFHSAITKSTCRADVQLSASHHVIKSFWQRGWYYLFNISKIPQS